MKCLLKVEGAVGWRIEQSRKEWAMEHPQTGLTATLDGETLMLTVKRNGNVILNENMADSTLTEIGTMLGNVARDEMDAKLIARCE